MPAVRSDNPLHAEINKYFNVHVYEWCGLKEVQTENGTVMEPKYLHAGICSANEVAVYIGNEEIKIKLFNKVLEVLTHKYTHKIRNRLKIDFYLK